MSREMLRGNRSSRGKKELFVASEQLYDVWFSQRTDIWLRARVTSFLRFRLGFFARTEVIDSSCSSNDKFLQTVMHLMVCNRKITRRTLFLTKTKCCLPRCIFKRSTASLRGALLKIMMSRSQ